MSDFFDWLGNLWGDKKPPKPPRGLMATKDSKKESKGLINKIKEKLSK